MNSPRYKNFIGSSPEIARLFDLLDKVMITDAPVLIQGESGTGKEMIAKLIHENSKRKNNPLVSVNCGAIPENLLESELFGHTKGAFTGAVETTSGLFEHAHGGTLLLDEIGDMPLSMQVKLLRALQDMEIRPVGGTKSKKIDVRIICATHQNLSEWIKKGKFREDLYYRINVAEITIPSLKERKEDIPLLINYFLKKYAQDNGTEPKIISAECVTFLTECPWPGNVRQLENMIYNLCVFSEKKEIAIEEIMKKRDLLVTHKKKVEAPVTVLDLFSDAIDQHKISLTQAKHLFEKMQIERALKIYGGKVSRAAAHLQMQRPQVSRLIKRYHIDKGKAH